mmetsp:Transcript_14019/g.21877  ORF Transcript_14019/g.21877 Transcript_14019/m.21877 type:complete len:261 (-) Transcript_14019:61-843(-)
MFAASRNVIRDATPFSRISTFLGANAGNRSGRALSDCSKGQKSSSLQRGTPGKAPKISNIDGKQSFFSNPLQWYAEKLETHPLLTKCLTSGLIGGSGDILCQFLVYSNNNDQENEVNFQLDWYRTGRFGFLGCFFVAPVVHFWYGALTKMIPGNSLSVTLKRTFLDQACFAPIFLPTFMLNLMVLEGRSTDEILPRLKEDVPDTLIANWSLWAPAMMINFRFVPLKFQVLFSNLVGFVWNAYLSWKTHESTHEAVAESRM